MDTPQVAKRIGVTYRQIDYWVRCGCIRGVTQDPGSGNHREWPAAPIAIADRMARLVQAGMRPPIASGIANRGPGNYDVAPGIQVTLEDCS